MQMVKGIVSLMRPPNQQHERSKGAAWLAGPAEGVPLAEAARHAGTPELMVELQTLHPQPQTLHPKPSTLNP